jgi:DNA repair exonuclease SbcCD nuclease subunit
METCLVVLESVRLEAKKRGCAGIACLGDFFHLRYQIPIVLLNLVKRWRDHVVADGLELLIQPGNHDQADELGANALEVFAGEGVRVFTDPTIRHGCAWIPYRKDLAEVKAWLDFARAQGVKVVFGHLPVLGAFQNNMIKDANGCPLSWFKGFALVVLGHYHKRQQWGAVHYVGSPWQTRADEAGQAKGFAVVDLEKPSLEYVTTQWGRAHHRVDLSDKPLDNFLARMKWAGIQHGDRVRVTVQSEADVEKAKQGLAQAGFLDAVVEPKQVTASGPRLGLGKGATLGEYARAYAAERKGQLDEAVLVQTFEEILGRK